MSIYFVNIEDEHRNRQFDLFYERMEAEFKLSLHRTSHNSIYEQWACQELVYTYFEPTNTGSLKFTRCKVDLKTPELALWFQVNCPPGLLCAGPVQ